MKPGVRLLGAAISLILMMLGASLAWAAPGDPDAGFGSDGVVTTDIGSPNEEVGGLAHQSDGSILVAVNDDDSQQIHLLKYRPDGTLDTGFGTAGKKVLPLSGTRDAVSRLLVTPDDSLIVVGHTFGTEWDLLVWKLDPVGDPDTGFGGGDGKVVADLINWDFANGALLDASGRIVVTGRVGVPAGHYEGMVARFTAAGVLDTTFSSDGWLLMGGGVYSTFDDVVLDGSGRVVTTGSSALGGSGLIVARFTAAGNPDTSLAAGGYVTPSLPDTAEGAAVDVDGSGRLVVGGYIGTDSDILVLRLGADGTLDASFGGGDGVVARDFGGYVYDAVRDLEVTDAGTIVVVGLAGEGGLVARLKSSGAFDAAFSGDGFVITDVTSSSESLSHLSIDSEDRIVGAGYFQDAGTGANDVMVVRYLGVEPPAPTTTTTVPGDENSFDDDDGSVHEADIEALAASGVTRGCGERLFCPRDPVTRGQMAAFLRRAFTVPSPPGSPDSFTDDDDSVFESDIEALAASGITRGCGPGSFCPEDPVTRGQMAAFLVRAIGLPRVEAGPDTFSDDDGSVFESDIEALAASGITRGCGPESFCPDDLVTREQMASFIVRALTTLEG